MTRKYGVYTGASGGNNTRTSSEMKKIARKHRFYLPGVESFGEVAEIPEIFEF